MSTELKELLQKAQTRFSSGLLGAALRDCYTARFDWDNANEAEESLMKALERVLREDTDRFTFPPLPDNLSKRTIKIRCVASTNDALSFYVHNETDWAIHLDNENTDPLFHCKVTLVKLPNGRLANGSGQEFEIVE